MRKFTTLVGKVQLKGLWLPDQKKILIDEGLPQLKQRWITAHEIGHRITPWHSEFFIGDTAETLDPEYHDMLEQEANYAASSLLFMASRFSNEAADYQLSFASVSALSKIYGNTQTTTLRRFVQFGRDKPMVGIVSKPHWLCEADEELCRYFIPSRKFCARFSKITSQEIVAKIAEFTVRKSGGPIGGGEFILLDDNGVAHEFIGDSFFNRYDVLTLIVYKQQRPIYSI